MSARADYRRLLLLTFVLAAATYLAGNDLVSLWDRDEPRYALASQHMAAGGDLVVPQLMGEPRLAKPVLIYWLQAGAMRIFGVGSFAARLPSVIGMLLTLVVLAAVVPHIAGRRRAAWSAFILACSVLAIACAKMALTDAVLLLLITASQCCVYALWRGRRSVSLYVALGLSVGLAALAKGPVVLGYAVTTLLAVRLLRIGLHAPARPPRHHGWSGVIGISVALIVAAACVAPWLIAIERRVPGYLVDTLRSEIVRRGAVGAEGHAGPPGYYLVALWGTYFPWSLFLPATLLWAWRRRRIAFVRFSLAAVLGPWVMLEVYRTKLPHYFVATLPFLALLTADLIVRSRRRLLPQLNDRGFFAMLLTARIVVMLLAAAAWWTLSWPDGSPWMIAGLLAMTLIAWEAGRYAARGFRLGQIEFAAVVLGIGICLVVTVAHTLWLPLLGPLQLGRHIAASLPPGRAMMIDYKEPSLAFYQGGTIREQRRASFLIDTPPEAWPDVLVISSGVWQRQPATVQSHWNVVASHEGLAYADRMRWIRVLTLRRNAPPLR